MWLTGERSVPGPAVAYLRLFASVPHELQRLELLRASQKGSVMREGMYRISFSGRDGYGIGIIMMQDGRVTGVDEGRVRYDGTYDYEEGSGLAKLKVKITFPPHVQSVVGIQNPYEWSFDVTTEIDPRNEHGQLKLTTSFGEQILAEYSYLRSLPEAA
jgi:hypothetical protein